MGKPDLSGEAAALVLSLRKDGPSKKELHAAADWIEWACARLHEPAAKVDRFEPQPHGAQIVLRPSRRGSVVRYRDHAAAFDRRRNR